jgi:hypothetical protein
VWALAGVLLAAPVFWTFLRVRLGLPALPWARPGAGPAREEPALQRSDG